jgi:hypothetical protein
VTAGNLSDAMTYTGIDDHERYSVACTPDGQGRGWLERRIDDNAPEAFAAYFAALDEPSEGMIEACWRRRRGALKGSGRDRQQNGGAASRLAAPR